MSVETGLKPVFQQTQACNIYSLNICPWGKEKNSNLANSRRTEKAAETSPGAPAPSHWQHLCSAGATPSPSICSQRWNDSLWHLQRESLAKEPLSRFGKDQVTPWLSVRKEQSDSSPANRRDILSQTMALLPQYLGQQTPLLCAVDSPAFLWRRHFSLLIAADLWYFERRKCDRWSSSSRQVFVSSAFCSPFERHYFCAIKTFWWVRCMDSVWYRYLDLYKIPGITAHCGNPAKGAINLSSSAVILNIQRHIFRVWSPILMVKSLIFRVFPMQAACSQGGSLLLKCCSGARDLGEQQHITEGSESELQPLNPNPREAVHVHFQLADVGFRLPGSNCTSY